MSRVEDLNRALGAWTPGAPPAATWLLPELRELLKAEFAGAYRPSATNVGWTLDFMHGAGVGASNYVRLFRQYVGTLPGSEGFLALGNPHLVEPAQRNRVMLLRDILRLRGFGERAEPFDSLYRALDIGNHDQLRVVVCDGPRQLAWVGATRAEPFTERESRILRRLATSLRERLRLENQLANPALLAAAFEATLEALPTAAFVIGPRGKLEVANRTGIMLWERDRKEVLDAIRESETGGPDVGAFSITRLVSQGNPPYLLAIRKERTGVLERVLTAQRKWGLTVRQARVLELVATGATNKEIACTLACSEPTVENHVTELFRRSGATSRAGLVTRLLL